MPGKVITDPVHGDIFLTLLEVAVIDSRPFQRLRRIRQLGNTHLVYPGAVHSRFSHSLGAVKIAQLLLDIVWQQSGELHGVDNDLFAEWRQPGRQRSANEEWARATVLARLGALLHDLCHVSAGHTVEDDLEVLEAHDENEERFEELWRELREDVPARLRQSRSVGEPEIRRVEATLLRSKGELHRELRPLIISKGKRTKKLDEMRYPFCADLVGNTICADLLDYLDRDHLFTGLPESLGRRFVSAFFVTPSQRGPFSRRLALNIMRHGHERTDIVSELLKGLRYRYELSERALVHHAKLAADAMLGESIERWEWTLWWTAARREISRKIRFLESQPDFGVERIPAYRAQLEKKAGKGEMSEEAWAATPYGRIRKVVRGEMEKDFRRLGDEGLIDHLISLPDRAGDPRFRSVLTGSADLAKALRDRRLFKIAERVGSGDVSPKHVYERYGDPAMRAELETEAQHFARLGTEPKVILWIPPPDMRLKLAEVLVQQEAGISPFVTYERSRSRRGSDIYDAHQRLWAAYVFVRRDVDETQKAIVAAYLGKKMGIRWERHRYLGGTPDQWPLRLAVAKVFRVGFKAPVEKKLEKYGPKLQEVAARTPRGQTFESLCREVEHARHDGS